MPSIQRNNKSRQEAARKATILGLAFTVGCGLGFFAWFSSGEEAQLFFDANVLQRSLSAETSPLLYLRANEQQVKDHGEFEPIHCPALLQQARAKGNQVVDPNQGLLHGKQIDIDPKFWISLHNKETDATRWDIMNTGVYYEKALSEAFVQVLNSTTPGVPTRVVDVGGNIGFFTLLSAAHGPVTVDSFEPNTKNALRLCESLALNHWTSEFDPDCDPKEESSRVNVYPVGVGRKEGMMSFVEHSTNPGQGTFREHPPTSLQAKGKRVIRLDHFARERGWFETRPDIAILKVDVEGLEYTVVEGALELLQAKIVRNIFMEVSAREPEELELNKPALRLLQKTGYRLHKVGGWRGPDKDVEFPQDENIAEHIMLRTVAEKAKQLNLWWKLEEQ